MYTSIVVFQKRERERERKSVVPSPAGTKLGSFLLTVGMEC
jgi:hypothetical protein